MNESMRLQLYLATCGVDSRRRCADIIAAGRITVNGKKELRPWLPVSGGDVVVMDSRRLALPDRRLYYALHKPPMMVTSSRDPQGRPVTDDLVSGAVPGRLFHVGRLDYMSSGLLFYTNDGDFARTVTRPSRTGGIEKEYLVIARRKVDEELLKKFKRGVSVDGQTLRIARYAMLSERKFRIVLTEGRNRELRRLFNSFNIGLKRLHRERIGIVRLNGLPAGGIRKLALREVKYFLKAGDSNDRNH